MTTVRVIGTTKRLTPAPYVETRWHAGFPLGSDWKTDIMGNKPPGKAHETFRVQVGPEPKPTPRPSGTGTVGFSADLNLVPRLW